MATHQGKVQRIHFVKDTVRELKQHGVTAKEFSGKVEHIRQQGLKGKKLTNTLTNTLDEVLLDSSDSKSRHQAGALQHKAVGRPPKPDIKPATNVEVQSALEAHPLLKHHPDFDRDLPGTERPRLKHLSHLERRQLFGPDDASSFSSVDEFDHDDDGNDVDRGGESEVSFHSAVSDPETYLRGGGREEEKNEINYRMHDTGSLMHMSSIDNRPRKVPCTEDNSRRTSTSFGCEDTSHVYAGPLPPEFLGVEELGNKAKVTCKMLQMQRGPQKRIPGERDAKKEVVRNEHLNRRDRCVCCDGCMGALCNCLLPTKTTKGR